MRSKGFTLIEILVVVVIMAVVISLAVLSIGVTGRDTQLDEESRRIEGLVDLLHERALLEGRDFGLRHRAHGLRVRGLFEPPATAGCRSTMSTSFATATCRRA